MPISQDRMALLSSELRQRLQGLFSQHRSKVERLNTQKIHGSGSSNTDLLQRVYEGLQLATREYKELANQLKGCQALRKERKEIFEVRINEGVIKMQQLTTKKGLKIKATEDVIRMLAETERCVKEARTQITNFQKEASTFFNEAYSKKPKLQQCLIESQQWLHLWASIGRLDSVTADSVKEIYLPVDFDQAMLKEMQNDIASIVAEATPIPPSSPAPVPMKVERVEVRVPIDDSLRLAHELLFGFTRSQEPSRAIQLYRKESEKADCDPTALNALGAIYEEGKYLRKDIKKACIYFMRSVKAGNAEGFYKIGQLLQTGQINVKEHFTGLYPNREAQIRGAIQYYEKAAKAGHLNAITDLGYIYEKGVTVENGTGYYVEPYPQHAVKYYKVAKAQDFPRAYNNLGAIAVLMRTEQFGVGLQKGIKYLERAVELKYPKSYLNLGKCYLGGIGVSENIDRARALFLQGSEQGDIQCKLEYVKTFLSQSLDDRQVMMRLLDVTRQVLLVQDSNNEALYYMGLFQQRGIGTEPNKQSSYFYISTAATLGHPRAITKLGDFYFSGYYVAKDIVRAIQLYERAAEMKNTEAMINLGLIKKKHGQTEAAKHLFEEAARLGDKNAYMHMNIDAADPEGVVNRAAELGSIDAVKILAKTKSVIQTGNQELKRYNTMYSKFKSTIVTNGVIEGKKTYSGSNAGRSVIGP